jgi:hypothetical protein
MSPRENAGANPAQAKIENNNERLGIADANGRLAFSVAGRFGPLATGVSLFLLLSSGSLFLLASQFNGLLLLDEIGYRDSYILYDVQHFQRTGEIYRDLSQPPYLPAQYSPLVYIIYALPRLNVFGNPFLGPRLVGLTAFLGCIAMVISIVRALIPVRSAWLWGVLLATSIPMEQWVLQIRGDFLAILFALTAIRLLLIRSPYAVLLAGASAGFATQFKFVYLAAILAGSLWLLLRRKWKLLGIFAAAGACSSAGLYILFWFREPRMLAQILALSPGIPDVVGSLKLIRQVLETPVVLLALAALPGVISRLSPRWMLLFMFSLASFGMNGLAAVQSGANLNYFFESLLALVPFAVLGTLHLLAWSRTRAGLASFLAGLILFEWFLPKAESLLHFVRSGPHAAAMNDARFRKTAAGLEGLRIFSTVPRMALLDTQPALVEPFLLTYMSRLGKTDMHPILERVRRAEFDIAITADSDTTWRGIHHVTPQLRKALMLAYKPYCTLPNEITSISAFPLVYLPLAKSADGAVIDRLSRIGCMPYPPVPSFP